MRIILTLFCFSLLLFNSISHSTIRRYRRHHQSNYNKKNVKVLKNYLHKLRKMNQHYEENKKWVEQMEKEGKFDGLISDVEDNDDNDEYYMRGWLKFFDFVPSDEHSIDDDPTKFNINEEFYQDKDDSETECLSDSDQSDGDQYNKHYNEIPGDTSFYFILGEHQLFVLSHYQDYIKKIVKSLDLDWVDPPEDIGNNDSGHCFRLVSINEVVWNMCAPNEQEKQQWMRSLNQVTSKKRKYFKI